MALSVTVLLLAGCAALTGCTAQRMPSGPEPTGPAPEPVPSGALYGRVLRQDGRAATRSTVSAFQLSDEDKVRTGAAIVSLGFFCLVPDFCPRSVAADVDTTGRYAFPADKIKSVPHVTVTARHAAENGQATGAEVVVSFDRAVSSGDSGASGSSGMQQRVPDLRYWEPAVSVRRTGTDAVVTWPAFPGGADYSLWTVADDDSPEPTGVATHDTQARLDLRPFEDQPTALILVATTSATMPNGHPAEYAYHTGSVALPAAGAPPSRERPCSIGDPGSRLVAAATPCPLTDGNLGTNAVVTAACPSSPCATPSSGSASTPTRHRICVDLGTPRPVSLVAYRTPFLTEGTIVELSTDGTHFHRTGTPLGGSSVNGGAANTGAGGDLHVWKIAPVEPARLACVRNDRFGFAGAILDEISVW